MNIDAKILNKILANQIQKCKQNEKMKDKNHMIVSTHAEKSFNKIPHQFKIKSLSKVEIEGIYLNIINAIYVKPAASIVLKWQRVQYSL